jgi:hypothetical protein
MMVRRPLSGERFAHLTVTRMQIVSCNSTAHRQALFSSKMFSHKRLNAEAEGTRSFPSKLLDDALNEGSPTKISKHDSLWYGQGRRAAPRRKNHMQGAENPVATWLEDLSGQRSDDSIQVEEGSVDGGRSSWSPMLDDGPGLDQDSPPLTDTATKSDGFDSPSDNPDIRSNHDEELEIYVDTMNSEVAGFDYVGGKVYVVQGWDSSRCQTTVSPLVVQRCCL